jgi:hypothetical protein
MRRPRRVWPAPRTRFVPCSRCADGLLFEERIVAGQLERLAVRCACLKAWIQAEKSPRPSAIERERRDLA